jgi:hypothetical protein
VAAVIEVSGLIKRYGQLEAVRGNDDDQHPLHASRPTAGAAHVAGFDVARAPATVRSRIGLVFKDPSLDDQLTAREDLELHGRIYGVPGALRRQRIELSSRDRPAS